MAFVVVQRGSDALTAGQAAARARRTCPIITRGLVIRNRMPMSHHRRKSSMQRLRNTGIPLPPRPGGSWLLGMVIGTTIMTMATQAIVLGAGAAIQGAA